MYASDMNKAYHTIFQEEHHEQQKSKDDCR